MGTMEIDDHDLFYVVLKYHIRASIKSFIFL